MARVIVEIDLPEWEYEDLKRDLIDDPDPALFKNENVETGVIAIYKSLLKEDNMDNDFCLFKLVDVTK